MTELYFTLVCRFLTKSKLVNFQLVCCGDRYQSIYQFKDADYRFLTLAKQIWPFLSWKECTLHESYRLTTCMSHYVNQALIGKDRIGQHCRVDYYYGNMFDVAKTIANQIIEWIKDKVYKPSDFYILCYSTKAGKSEKPSQKIENILKKANPPIPILVPGNESDQLTNDVIKDKLIITTFHQSKGNERKVVVLLSFDQSFFMFNARNTPDHMCPELIYVAATRASERLILTHSNEMPHFKFQQINIVENTPEFVELYKKANEKKRKET
ncbi:hypothetical protein EBS02_09955, partial [bacterium]|nr:hypothetical protein [bacterium]